MIVPNIDMHLEAVFYSNGRKLPASRHWWDEWTDHPEPDAVRNGFMAVAADRKREEYIRQFLPG